MKRLLVVAAAAALAAFTGAGTIAAQVPTFPVYNWPIPAGFTILADVAFPSSSTNTGTSYAGTLAFGTGAFGFTLSGGGTSAEVDTFNLGQATIGGTVNWRAIGGPAMPWAVNLQVGVAYWEIGDPPPDLVPPPLIPFGEKLQNFHVPVGVSVMYTVITSGLAIKPWIAPRVDYSRNTLADQSVDNTDFAFSIGLNLAFRNGLGVRAAYDWLQSDGPTRDTFGVGAYYSFTAPDF